MSRIAGVLMAVVMAGSMALTAQQPQEQLEEPVSESFFYGALGVGPLPFLVPTFGFGYNVQNGHYGADIALDFSTVYVLSSIRLSPTFHYYSTPNLDSQFYTGMGLGISLVNPRNDRFLDKMSIMLAPEFVFGKKYRNEVGGDRFFQVITSWPTYSFEQFNASFAKNHMVWAPIVYVKYGVSF